MGEAVVSIERRPSGLVMSVAPGRDAQQIRTDRLQFSGKNVNYKMQFWTCFESAPAPSSSASVEYMAHEAGIGDVPWVSQGVMCGTTGQGRALEGVAIRSSTVDMRYRGHIAYQGDTG